MLSPEEIDVYVRAYRQPGAVRGAAMDYRATGEDVKQDMVDAAQLITCPVLVLWGQDFELNSRFFNLLDVWRGMAEDVRGLGMSQCGHLCQEERPDTVSYTHLSPAARKSCSASLPFSGEKTVRFFFHPSPLARSRIVLESLETSRRQCN